MTHRTSRRLAGAVAGAALIATAGLAHAQDERTLEVDIVANSLGIHIPYMAALNEVLPEMEGYGQPNVERNSKLEVITQSVLTGSSEFGAGDAISTLRAVEAGADLKIIGNAFTNTSLVFVANTDTIKEMKDLENDGVTVAVNSPGDFTHVMLIKPLQDAGVNIDEVNVITMGGSGTRLRALLAGRVDAVPIHFDQAAGLPADKYKVLIEPWDVYDNFLGEVWMASGEWLDDEANQRAAVDLLKANIKAFRRAQDDPEWYAAAFREYGTQDTMASADDETIEMVRSQLAETVNAWPSDMNHRLAVYEELMPIYKAAGAVEGTVNLEEVVDTRFVEQALKELEAE